MAARIKVEDAPERPMRMNDEQLIEQFEALLVIDKMALDSTIEQHPDLMYRVSEIVTERIAQRDAAKLDISEIEARVDVEMRRDAATAGEKATDKAVAAETKIDSRVITAVNRHADLVYWVNRWSALQSAFAARQTALRDLVNLYANNYWADASGGSRAVVRSKAGEIARDALKAERQRRAKS